MKISQKLSELGLISGESLLKVFDNLYQDILDIEYNSEGVFIKEMWERYNAQKEHQSKNMNGYVFEGLLATILYRTNLLPLFIQAKIAFVPNVNFDFVLYSKEIGPIVISAKTSLRERYKQADLEGMMLRQVHRKSESYLLTLDKKEAETVNDKVLIGEVLGLNKVILATSTDFDNLISRLKELTFYEPKQISIITCNRTVYQQSNQ